MGFMQGTRIHLIVGGLLLAAASSSVQAEALQPDPAWQQGALLTGFHGRFSIRRSGRVTALNCG